MLGTDLMAPGSRNLARLADGRVRQFWDPHRVMAAEMSRDARDPQPTPACCRMDGALWDLAAVYPPGAQWDDRLPPARVFDGPIVRAGQKVAAAIGEK